MAFSLSSPWLLSQPTSAATSTAKAIASAPSTATKTSASTKRGMQHAEASRRRVDHQIARQCDGGDQPLDQADRLGMRMNLAINLLAPAVANAVIAPIACDHWRPLQHPQVVATAPRALSHT